MKLETLLKKREQIEAQILQAERHEKRKMQIGELAEKAGILDATDEEILTALRMIPAKNGMQASQQNQA